MPAFQIRSRDWYKPRLPEVDLKYRAFLRSFPCCACGARRYIEFMHTGPRGLGQKADDKDGLPGCSWCHRTGPKALHKLGPVEFQRVHGIDFDERRKFYRKEYGIDRTE